jgi:hypothetical protein
MRKTTFERIDLKKLPQKKISPSVPRHNNHHFKPLKKKHFLSTRAQPPVAIDWRPI